MERSSGTRSRPSQKSSLPTGTVTFLFSDIEGSTVRWESHREAMVDDLRRHDAILRRAIISSGGHVFKTVGDAFCAAFAVPAEAIVAAIEAQRALQRADWTRVDGLLVRMAIHTGSADARDGDYFGPTVNRVARLLAIGYGGQILVSRVTAELSEGSLQTDVTFRDLGEHKLKDVDRRERVYQVCASKLTADFPPLRSLDAFPNNLPYQLTSFVGRDTDVAEIKALLESSRLVTLTGTGGIGKTRCALQVGAEVLHSYSQGVWFAELASVTDPEFVVSAVALALRIREIGDQSLADAIVAFLKNRSILLILDNCEHVVEQAGILTDAILRTCEHVSVLTTSREPLGIQGEQVYQVGPLSTPPAGDAPDTSAAMQYGAV
ncbi:MAG: adenylate/guanylate cyclase domain-containing protein, partial [Candidatus Tumulicola sp.]